MVEEENKRARDEGEEGQGVPAQENAEKKPRVSSVEAEPAAEEEKETLDAVEAEKDEEILAEAEAEDGESSPASGGDGKLKQASATPSEAKIGPKVFTSSMDMFNFFYDLLRTWPINFNLNKYEHLMLEDLINQGHQEPQKKIGAGIEAFQVRINPDFYSRCYYIVRVDGSVDDFSYRKCVDNILPLPEDIKARAGDLRLGNKNKGPGGHHDNRGRGGRGGGGRGGGWGGRRGGGGGHGRGNRGRGGRF